MFKASASGNNNIPWSIEIGMKCFKIFTGDIQNAFSSLLSDNDNHLDISSLISNFNEGGLGGLVSSWLGDGNNEGISADQIMNIFGTEKIQGFADNLGISPDNAVNGLSESIPALIDKASSGGNLLESVGGLDGVMSMAKKFF